MLVRKSRNIEKLMEKIKKLAENNVQSGYFSSQGDHPTADMPYTELAYVHAVGVGNLPQRDVRPSVMLEMKSNNFSRSTGFIITNYFYKNRDLSTVLDSLGHRITDTAKSHFGIPSPTNPPNSPYYAEAKGGNTPLVLDGYLRDNWSYITSENLTVRGT